MFLPTICEEILQSGRACESLFGNQVVVKCSVAKEILQVTILCFLKAWIKQENPPKALY